MATQTSFKSASKNLEAQLIELANAQYETDEYKRLFKTKFSKKGAQVFFLQHAHFNLNRRDCWGYVQGASPMHIKKLVWEHEEEELADHYALAVKQGSNLGLTPDDYKNSPQLDGTFTACQAWLNVAQKSHWLEAFAASACLEVANSEELIKGGCISRRMGEKLQADLGIPMSKQYSNAEHVVADVEHGLLLLKVAREAENDTQRQLILDGTNKSFAIDRIFRSYLASLVEKYA
jgi:hypothetical protein